MNSHHHAVPLLARRVIARRETNGVLLFHQPSDEMYFIPTKAYELVKLCDGSRTVGQLCALATGSDPADGDSATRIAQFLSALADREVIEWWT